MTVLVVGATGLVGKHIAVSLGRGGHEVRGLVRGGAESPKASDLSSQGVEPFDGDLRRPDTLTKACEGMDAVVCTATTMPAGADDGVRRVDRDGVLALIEAAERAGVRKFVYTSFSGTLTTPSALLTAKRDCEARLLASRLNAVVLRPTYFMEVWLGPHLGVDPLNGTVRIYGSGEAKISYISAFNVADFAVAALHRDTGRQAILEMGGPEALSQLDVVRVFERVLGVSCRLESVPADALRKQHNEATDPLQKTFTALMLGCAAGDPIPGAVELAREYGVTLRSVEEYAASLRQNTAGV